MIEIKTEMSPPQEAIPAQPARPHGFSVTTSAGDYLHWSVKEGALHCYRREWMEIPLTAVDFRTFAALLTEIADRLETNQANGAKSNA